MSNQQTIEKQNKNQAALDAADVGADPFDDSASLGSVAEQMGSLSLPSCNDDDASLQARLNALQDEDAKMDEDGDGADDPDVDSDSDEETTWTL